MEKGADMRYFNFHAHLTTTTLGEAYDAEQLVKDMTALGVERVGISNLLLPTTKEKNDLIYEAKCKYPKMIRAYMYVNFKDEDICEEIEKRMEDQHFDGFKIITAWDGVRADHFPKVARVMGHIQKYGKIVQIGTAPSHPPFTWIQYAEKYPRLPLCFTHIGSEEMGYSVIKAVKDYKNIVVETSQNFARFQLQAAIDELGSERVCMGTDWPYKPQYNEIHKFEYLKLTDGQMENIYYKNAARLWGEEV